MYDKLPFREFFRGYSFYGAEQVALRKICDDSGLEWSVKMVHSKSSSPMTTSREGLSCCLNHPGYAHSSQGKGHHRTEIRQKTTQAKVDARKPQEIELRKQAGQEKSSISRKGWLDGGVIIPATGYPRQYRQGGIAK